MSSVPLPQLRTHTHIHTHRRILYIYCSNYNTFQVQSYKRVVGLISYTNRKCSLFYCCERQKSEMFSPTQPRPLSTPTLTSLCSGWPWTSLSLSLDSTQKWRSLTNQGSCLIQGSFIIVLGSIVGCITPDPHQRSNVGLGAQLTAFL